MSILAWRVGTFLVGLYLLYWGSLEYHAPDWDLGVSVLMAFATALVMPEFDACIYAAKFHRKIPRLALSALILAFAVGCVPVQVVYTLYWQWRGHPEVQAFENFGASWVLFLMCWVIWCMIPRVLTPPRIGDESPAQPRQ